jgi:hypothetical protein
MELSQPLADQRYLTSWIFFDVPLQDPSEFSVP